MKILVTGGTGYIGSHTCVELIEAGHEPFVIDNLCNSHTESLRRVEKITGKAVPFEEIDLRDGEKLTSFMEREHFDCVMHFAGLKAVGESVQKPLLYYENNLDSTISLCRAMEKTGVGRIIFSSSATVYSGENEVPLRETSRTGDCSNPYGWTKFMCEKILTDFARAGEGRSVVLLRYFNPVGAHPSGLMGEDPRGIPNNLMPYITQTAAGRREKLTIFGNDYDTPDGTGVRDYIHIVDLARGHVAALGYLISHEGTEIFNLGTGTGYSVLDMVNAFMKATGVNIPYVIGPRRAGDLAAVYADPAKSREILHWEATHSLEDMCADAWRWQSGNPNGYENE